MTDQPSDFYSQFLHRYGGRELLGLVMDDSSLLRQFGHCAYSLAHDDLSLVEKVRRIVQAVVTMLNVNKAPTLSLDRDSRHTAREIPSGHILLSHAMADPANGRHRACYALATAVALVSSGLCADMTLISGDGEAMVHCRLCAHAGNGADVHFLIGPRTGMIACLEGNLVLGAMKGSQRVPLIVVDKSDI